MVDLVKLRKKAKGKNETAVEAGAPAPSPANPDRTSSLSADDSRSSSETARVRSELAPHVPSNQLQDGIPARRQDSAEEKLAHFKLNVGRKQTDVKAASAAGVAAPGAALLELLTFNLSGEQYAVEIEKIVEIVHPRPATRVPNAEQSVVGIISLRGTIVTLLDVRRRLGHPPETAGADARIVVIEHGGETAGFLVDRVLRVIKIDRSEVEHHPVVNASEQSESIRGVFQHGKTLGILLDLEKLIRS